MLLIGLFVSLIVLAAAAPAHTGCEARAEAEEAAAAGTVFGVFFWVLIIGFLIAVIAGYAT